MSTETGLIPCPSCGAVRHHPMTEGAERSWQDGCMDSVFPGGCQFAIVQIAATCAACGHAWDMERHYSEPDTTVGILFSWHYPDGRVFEEFDRNEPAFLSPVPDKP